MCRPSEVRNIDQHNILPCQVIDYVVPQTNQKQKTIIRKYDYEQKLNLSEQEQHTYSIGLGDMLLLFTWIGFSFSKLRIDGE